MKQIVLSPATDPSSPAPLLVFSSAMGNDATSPSVRRAASAIATGPEITKIREIPYPFVRDARPSAKAIHDDDHRGFSSTDRLHGAVEQPSRRARPPRGDRHRRGEARHRAHRGQ